MGGGGGVWCSSHAVCSPPVEESFPEISKERKKKRKKPAESVAFIAIATSPWKWCEDHMATSLCQS